MRYRLPIVVTLIATLALAGCGSTLCKPMTGYPKTVCEVAETVRVIEANVPPAIEVLVAMRPNVSVDIQVSIDRIVATWPKLQKSMDDLVAVMESGGQGNVGAIMADAFALYVDISALVVACNGHPLPGLPHGTTTLRAIQ